MRKEMVHTAVSAADRVVPCDGPRSLHVHDP